MARTLAAVLVLLFSGIVLAHEEHQGYRGEEHHHHYGWQGWPRLFEPQRYWYCNPWGHCWWRWRE